MCVCVFWNSQRQTSVKYRRIVSSHNNTGCLSRRLIKTVDVIILLFLEGNTPSSNTHFKKTLTLLQLSNTNCTNCPPYPSHTHIHNFTFSSWAPSTHSGSQGMPGTVLGPKNPKQDKTWPPPSRGWQWNATGMEQLITGPCVRYHSEDYL